MREDEAAFDPILQQEEIDRQSYAALIAAGSGKAEAISAVLRQHPHKLPVPDEGAAKKYCIGIRLFKSIL